MMSAANKTSVAEPLTPGHQSIVTPGQFKSAKIFTAWLRDYGGIPVKVARSFAVNPEESTGPATGVPPNLALGRKFFGTGEGVDPDLSGSV